MRKHHSEILLTNLPQVSPPSGNILWNTHAAGRLSSTSEMTYASILDIVRFHERRFHCAYVPEDERVCGCGEGKCLDHFWGIITVKLGIVGDRNRFLSFVRSVRINENEKKHTEHASTDIPNSGEISLSIASGYYCNNIS
jgi:hypothetical protein